MKVSEEHAFFFFFTFSTLFYFFNLKFSLDSYSPAAIVYYKMTFNRKKETQRILEKDRRKLCCALIETLYLFVSERKQAIKPVIGLNPLFFQCYGFSYGITQNLTDSFNFSFSMLIGNQTELVPIICILQPTSIWILLNFSSIFLILFLYFIYLNFSTLTQLFKSSLRFQNSSNKMVMLMVICQSMLNK